MKRPATQSVNLFIVHSILAIVVFLAALPGTAAADTPSPVTVLLGVSTIDAAKITVLKTSLQSHLADYDALIVPFSRTQPTRVTAHRRDMQPPEEVVDSLARHRAIAAVWLTAHQFHLVIGNETDVHYQVRPLPAGDDRWDVKCDAIASSVRSSLSTYLDAFWSTSPSADDDERQPSDGISEAPIESSGTPVDAKEPTSDVLTPVTSAFQLGLEAAYTPRMLSGNTPWMHGGRLSLLFRRSPIATVRLGIGSGGLTHGRFRFFRFPIEGTVVLGKAVNRFFVGGETGVVVEVARLDGGHGVDTRRRIDAFVGIRGVLVGSVSLVSAIEVRMSAGVAVYNKGMTYLDGLDRIVFESGPVHGIIESGVVFWL